MHKTEPLRHTIEAYNISHASENKIHDDTVAGQLGFQGGLVPGVEIFAYATHVALQHFGPDFLTSGWMTGRFAKPVYDGAMATVIGTPADDGSLSIVVESADIACAAAEARMPAPPPKPPAVSDYEEREPPSLDDRPPADETSLAVGTVLCSPKQTVSRDDLGDYLDDVREIATIYPDEGIVHPGILLRLCNSALKDNVVLAPWIHVGSTMQNFARAHVGDVLSARACVTGNTERKGHRFVDMDCLIVANGERAVAQVAHTAIYKLRQLSD